MRSDILVSVGVVDEQGPTITVPRLAGLIEGLARAYRYFEVVYVVSEGARGELDALAAQIAPLANLRIIITGESTRFYRQRLIAMSEAIGDVVALFDLDDLGVDTLVAKLGEAKDNNEIMIGWRSARHRNRWSYGLLSLASRNHITAQAARTILIPRELMNGVISRRSAALDLRFEPRIPQGRYRRFEVAGKGSTRGGFAQRYELFIEILLCGAPRYLKAYAAAGFMVMIGASLYMVYALAVVLLRKHVQEGWFSTTITQAGSTAFIAGGMSILSIALIAIYERLHGGEDRIIVDEIANTSFFDKVTDRNVELTGGGGRAFAGTPVGGPIGQLPITGEQSHDA